MGLLFLHLLLVSLPETWVPVGQVLSSSAPLDVGYRQMYNLQFKDAHRTFQNWQKDHPDDPFAYTSDAAAYVFEEFDRMGVLQSDLFVDDANFKRRKAPTPDPVIKARFEEALAKSDELADIALQRSPRDSRALLAKVLALGLRGDYLALVQKRDLASLSYMKRAGALAERLLAVDPECYDAYLAVGVENYLLGLSAAPVRWVLRLYGAQTNKELGIEKLQLTATKGHYLLPFARLLLAVAAMRDHDRAQARELLGELAREFPQNNLYQKEFARIQ